MGSPENPGASVPAVATAGPAAEPEPRRPRWADRPVVVVQDGDIAQALRRLARLTEKAGLIRELRDRRFYRSPGERQRMKARRARKAAARRAARAARWGGGP
jgi:ribosomal protein S21